MQTQPALPIEFIITSVHKLLSQRIPFLSWMLPIDAFMAIVKGATAYLKHDLTLDSKDVDFEGISTAGMELLQAVIYRNAKEIKEAVYAIMCVFTNLEEFLTMEEFVEHAQGDSLMPTKDITPHVPQESTPTP